MKFKKGGIEKAAYGTISLPTPLIEKVKEKIEGTGMHSVSAYVSFILRQIFSSPSEEGNLFSKKEEDEIRRRLKSLGYI